MSPELHSVTDPGAFGPSIIGHAVVRIAIGREPVLATDAVEVSSATRFGMREAGGVRCQSIVGS